MPVSQTLGSKSYNIPIVGDNSGWGDDLTSYLLALGSIVNSASPAGTINLSSAALLGSQTNANVTNFSFSSAICKAFKATYHVVRATASHTEIGDINGVFDGTNWQIANINISGNAYIDFSCPSGSGTCQIQYTTTGSDTGTIYFKTLAIFPN